MTSVNQQPHDSQHLRGALRGLNPNNVLASRVIEQPIEISDDEDDNNQGDENNPKRVAGLEIKHVTRASRSGRIPALYDSKYHPMDEVTRPERTRKRRSGSCSLSIPALPSEGETDEESLPSSARDTGQSSEAHDDDDSDDNQEVATARRPDPKASRRSARSQAQKSVNYDAKHHPQDGRIPGFQHRARSLRANDENLRTSSKKRKANTLTPELPDEASEDVEVVESSRPRKQLRTLEDERPSPQKIRRAKKGQTSGRRGHQQLNEPIDDVEELMKQAIRGSQVPRSQKAATDLRSKGVEDAANLRTPTSSERAQCQDFANTVTQMIEDTIQDYDSENPLDDLERSGDRQSSPHVVGAPEEARDVDGDPEPSSNLRSPHGPTSSLRYENLLQVQRNDRVRSESEVSDRDSMVVTEPGQTEEGHNPVASHRTPRSTSASKGNKDSVAKKTTSIVAAESPHYNGALGVARHAVELEEHSLSTQARDKDDERTGRRGSVLTSEDSPEDMLLVSQRECSDEDRISEVPDTEEIRSNEDLQTRQPEQSPAPKPSISVAESEVRAQSDKAMAAKATNSTQLDQAGIYPSPKASFNQAGEFMEDLLSDQTDGANERRELIPRSIRREETAQSTTSGGEYAASQSLLQTCDSSQPI